MVPGPGARFLRDVFICSLGAYGGPESHMSVFLKQLVGKSRYLSEEQLIELIARPSTALFQGAKRYRSELLPGFCRPGTITDILRAGRQSTTPRHRLQEDSTSERTMGLHD